MYRPKSVVPHPDDKTKATVTFVCFCCKKDAVLAGVSVFQLQVWDAGAFVQDAFPEMSKDDRELFISGTCGPCFKKLFGEPE